jgi:transposase
VIQGLRKVTVVGSRIFWLTDAQFAGLEPHLPTDTRGKPRVDNRRVISGIAHVLISGCRWKDAPTAYGPRKTLYNRFQRWAAEGVWSGLFRALATAGGPPAEGVCPAARARRSLLARLHRRISVGVLWNSKGVEGDRELCRSGA